MAHTITDTTAQDSEAWIKRVAAMLSLTDERADPGLRTQIHSDVKKNKLALFLPPEMADEQPENLRYLHALASSQQCILVEDRRGLSVQPIVEQRDTKPQEIAETIRKLVVQTGMPGPEPKLSRPHRLELDSSVIEIADLIAMAAHCIDRSKHAVLPPLCLKQESGKQRAEPVHGYACKIVTAEFTTTISLFITPDFKAISYIAGSQFVSHVLIGGGPLRSPGLWVSSNTLIQNGFRFQLFRSNKAGQDFGLLYNTFFLDLPARQTASRDLDTHRIRMS